jgi:ABC-2 type transport system permease protein
VSIWRLEWVRLARTRRLLVIAGVFLFFGLSGPLSARYLGDIVQRFGSSGGVKIVVPPPRPVDGIAAFTNNAIQLGLLIVVLIASSALAFDARREMAVFLRTRVRVVDIVLPAYVANAAAAAGGFLLGTVAAWYETWVLLGAPATGPMLAGAAYGALYLAFGIAVTAAAAAWVRSALGAAGIAIAFMLTLSVLGVLRPVKPWLPTSLGAAQSELLRGVGLGHYLPAAVVAVAASAACVALAVWLGNRREV